MIATAIISANIFFMHELDSNNIMNALIPYIGSDLRAIANEREFQIFREGKKKKGWAGLLIEDLAGLPKNSLQAPNGFDFELKLVSCKLAKEGWNVKETMAITMIDPADVLRRPFHESHLYAKLQRLVICAREWVDVEESQSRLLKVTRVELYDELKAQVKADYEECQEVIRTRGFSALTGKMGVLVQPRTKGPGHGSISRAFYARIPFVRMLLGDLPDWH